MDETALVKRPVVDDLAVKVSEFKEAQKSAELEQKLKKEAPLKRRALIRSFLCLAERYFGVPREFINNLSEKERIELLNQVFEEAKRRLRYKSLFFHAVFALSIVCIIEILRIHDDKSFFFPEFRVFRLYKWYMENYGADDLEKAVKSDEFAKKADNTSGSLIKNPEVHEIVLVVLPEGALEEYEKSAKSIGFIPAKLLQIQLANFLRNRRVKIFNYKEVFDYLKFLARANNKAWYWRPLREKDRFENYVYQGRCDKNIWYGFYYGKNWECRPYGKLIPLRVSKMVEEIEKKFGDGLHFLVSYYIDDPSIHYIAADALDMDMFIFDSWHDDELNQRQSIKSGGIRI